MNIVNFSGGKDSTAMLLMMLEKNMVVDRVICVDTTKEFPAMYKHLEKVQSMCPIEIEIVKIDFDYFFGEHIKTRGKRKGEKGYVLDMSSREYPDGSRLVCMVPYVYGGGLWIRSSKLEIADKE